MAKGWVGGALDAVRWQGGVLVQHEADVFAHCERIEQRGALEHLSKGRSTKRAEQMSPTIGVRKGRGAGGRG